MRTRLAYVAFVPILMLATLLCACSSSAQASADGATRVATQASSAPQLAALAKVDTNIVATGPNVGRVLGIADIKKILGRDDVVFSPAL